MAKIYKVDVTKLPWTAEETGTNNDDIIEELKEKGISSDQSQGVYYIAADSSEEALKKFESLDIETLEETGIDPDNDE